jgi:hypothetical protein
MVQPGYGQPYGAPQIPNNMATAVVGLLLFWPVGLFAVLSASKVNNLVAQGDFAGASDASQQAKKMGKLAIIIGAVILGLTILGCCGAIVIAAASGGSNGY